MLKPLIATKSINPISRGLFTAAKNSVGRVKESTQQITKGLNKDQKFPMNYVEFFGSKKTVKILRKNLKSVRDSLTSTFGFVSTLTKTVGGLFKKLGPGGLFGSLVGTIGATIFGGIFGKVLLVTLATLALGGIGALLVRNAPEFFKFLRSNIANLRPIVEEIIGDFALGRLTKPGDVEQARVLDKQVSLRAEEIIEKDPEIDPDVAYKKALNQTIGVIDKDIAQLRLDKIQAQKDGKPTDEIDGAIAALKRDKNYLRTGKIASKDITDDFTRTLLTRMFGIDPQGGVGFTGYSGMSKEQRLDRLNQVMRDNDLAKLKAESMRSGSFAGSASGDRLRFNLDLLNAIKAKENKQEFGVEDLQSDALTNKTLIDANKAILKQFNETYLKINQSPNKQSNVNVINKSGSGNKRGSGVNSGEKIVGDGAEGGTLSMKFLSPLNEDLAMERTLSKSVLNVYM